MNEADYLALAQSVAGPGVTIRTVQVVEHKRRHKHHFILASSTTKKRLWVCAHCAYDLWQRKGTSQFYPGNGVDAATLHRAKLRARGVSFYATPLNTISK